MINEIRMPNVYKVELRSPTKLKYQSVANWFRGEGYVCEDEGLDVIYYTKDRRSRNA